MEFDKITIEIFLELQKYDMEYKYESDDFHKTLEPMVIINDGLSPEVSSCFKI